MQLGWFVGVDWGSQTHQVCVTDAAGEVVAERAFEQSGQGLSEMADWLLSVTGGEAAAVGVAIEVPRGPVVESLLERGFVVHSINPKQLDRFRDRISLAGAKDDRRDARVLASALRTDAHCLRRLEPTDPEIVALREWSRLSEDLTQERVRLAHRMREQLWRYYPQFLKAVDDDVAAPWALDLWRSLPTPRAGQRARAVPRTRVLKQHRIRRLDAAALRERRRVPAVTLMPGTADAAATHVQLVVERLALVNRQRDHVRRQLDRMVHQLVEAAPSVETDSPADAEPDPSDGAILLSMPGIGVGVLATLLAAGSDAVRRRDYDALRCLCGVAPVTTRSGKSLLVQRRLAAHGRLREGPPSTGLVWPPSATRCATARIRRCAPAATGTHAPCVRWPTVCSTSPARCCATAPVSTRTASESPPREPARGAGLGLAAARVRLDGSSTTTGIGRRGGVGVLPEGMHEHGSDLPRQV